MPEYIYILIVLGLASTVGYFRGRNKNRWISGWVAQKLEDAFQPLKTSYVNIGGTIGYNFVFKLAPPFTEVKGTFTLLPRQSILYFPVSCLIVKYDRFYMNVFTREKLMGEGHVVNADYYGRMRSSIEGEDKMSKDRFQVGETEFLLFWDTPALADRLKAFLSRLEDPACVKHFCCYKANNTFFLFLALKDRNAFSRTVKNFYAELPSFFLEEGTRNKKRPR